MARAIAEEYNPTVYIDEGISLYDIIAEKATKIPGMYGWIEKNTKGQLIEHIYDTRKRADQIQIREIIRKHEDGRCDYKDCYYLSYGMGAGLHTIWENKRSQYYGAVEIYDKWEHQNEISECFARVRPINIQAPEEIIAMDINRLKYCAYTGFYDFMEYFKLYKKYPIAEMVMKLGLYQFLKEKALKWLTEEKAFRKYVYEHAEEIGRLSAQWTHNAYKRQVNAQDYASSLTYRIECGRDLGENLREQYEFIKRYTTQEKLHEWLAKNKIGASSYADYVKAARWFELNFEDTKVLFPRNFQEVHDEYIRQYNQAEAEKQAKAAEGISAQMEEIAKRYAYGNRSIDGYVFIIAHNKMDLIKEGSAQCHCVGKMDYDKRQAEGRSIIVFMRHEESQEQSCVTIEYSLEQKRVMQKYAKHNSTPEEAQIEIIDKWEKYMKRKITLARKQERIYNKDARI